MLIETYNLEIEASNHSVDEFEYEAVAYLPLDISKVLPYLNATLRNGTYFPDAPAFSWRQRDHKIGFWADRIAVEHLESREQAKAVIEGLVRLVNDTWDRRDGIEPDTTSRENLQPLELYRLLPRTNCKVCGESGCFAFALKLAAGQIEFQGCRPVCDDGEYEEQRAQLETLLRTKRPLL